MSKVVKSGDDLGLEVGVVVGNGEVWGWATISDSVSVVNIASTIYC